MRGINLGTIKPTFLIIGVQKGGTSSLHYYLTQHPLIVSANTKEVHYFDTSRPTPSKPYLKYFPKSYFTNKISFEATPRYIYYPGTAKRIFEFDSNMKFIVMLRDPAHRAYSSWNMYRQMSQDSRQVEFTKKHQKENSKDRTYSLMYSRDFPSFGEWVSTELSSDFPSDLIEPSIIKRGYYKEQIEKYLKFFSLDSFLFIDFDNFKENALGNLNRIASFLSISDFNNLYLDLQPQHQREYTNLMDESDYKRLLSHYIEKNKGLEELVNLELNWMRTLKI